MKHPESQLVKFCASDLYTKRTTRIAAILKVRTFILVCLILGAMTGCSCTCSNSACIEETPVSGEWSFAIITDLHIGRGYIKYEKQDYYLTKRLQEIVNWLNENGPNCKLQFVVILGDISEHGECLELEKAYEILKNLEIPYIHVIGNHDVWPSIKKEDGDKIIERPVEDLEYFGYVFEKNLRYLSTNRKFNGWSEEPISYVITENEMVYYLYNYAFTYNDVRFIFLDYVNRDSEGSPKPFEGTTDFLKENLPPKGEKVIIFSHFPIRSRWIKAEPFNSVTVTDAVDILKNHSNTTWHFAGHYHGFPWEQIESEMARYVEQYLDANIKLRNNFLVTPIPVILTEATMVGSNTEQPKSIIRIVTMTDDSSFNCTCCPKERFMIAANPRFYNHSRSSFPFSSFPQQPIDTQQEFNGTCYSKLDIINWEWSFGSLLKEGKTVFLTPEEIQTLLDPTNTILPVTLTVTNDQNLEEDIVYNLDFNQIIE